MLIKIKFISLNWFQKFDWFSQFWVNIKTTIHINFQIIKKTKSIIKVETWKHLKVLFCILSPLTHIPTLTHWCEQPWQGKSIRLKPVRGLNPSVVSHSERRGKEAITHTRSRTPPCFMLLNGHFEEICCSFLHLRVDSVDSERPVN